MPLRLKALKSSELLREPTTLGEHLKQRRLSRGLIQREAARELGVDCDTVLNWEKGHTTPPIESMPAVFRFLGYDPFPVATTLPDRMRSKRRRMGWTITEAARRCGVDDSTWGEWERGKPVAWMRYRDKLEALLDEVCHE